MLIEGAFLKIPEVLLSYEDRNGLYEASIVNILTNAVILEFNARNIDNPLTKLQLEKRYDISANIRCDLFANFDFIDDALQGYGCFQENWIETKYFGDLERAKGTQTKSENPARILYDLYRLARYANAERAVNKGLYFLGVFSHAPGRYLAFNRQDSTERTWLKSLLTCGVHDISFDLDDEPGCIKKIFGQSSLRFALKTRTSLFEPLDSTGDGFFGYLVQILSFDIVE